MTANLVQLADPRARLVVVLVLSTLALIFSQPAWLAGLLVLTLGLLMLSGTSPGMLLGKTRRFLTLFLALIVIQSLFTTTGEPLLALAGFTLVTSDGLYRGISVVLRLLTLMAGAGLILNVDPMKFVLGLVKLKLPYEIAYMVLMGIRFLPVLGQEIRDSFIAIQLRGVRIKEIPLSQRLGVYSALFMPVVAGAMIRARKTATAMEARAFRAYPQRTFLEELRLAPSDWAIMGVAVGMGVMLSFLYVNWG